MLIKWSHKSSFSLKPVHSISEYIVGTKVICRESELSVSELFFLGINKHVNTSGG